MRFRVSRFSTRPIRFFSHLNVQNLEITEELYAKYLKNKESVSKDWQNFFPTMKSSESFSKQTLPEVSKSADIEESDIKREILLNEILNFGYLTAAEISTRNEWNKHKKDDVRRALNDLENSSNSTFDYKGQIFAQYFDKTQISNQLDKLFCTNFGLEFMHIFDNKEKNFILTNYLNLCNKSFDNSEVKDTLLNILRVGWLEDFLQTKFPTTKRFGIEGCESAISFVYNFARLQSQLVDASRFIIGASHRGRINLLANVLEYPYKDIFSLFSENPQTTMKDQNLAGDVKYHMGFENDSIETGDKSKKLTMKLLANPSHLESINGAVYGSVRAYQNVEGSINKTQGIIFHGDSSICGQGIAYETLQMMRLNEFSPHGVIHIIINNQVGFTTPPESYKSMATSTSLCKAFDIPAIKINANCIESLLKASHLAALYRNEYHKDVLVEINGFRKHGHNEIDDPTITQASLYSNIASGAIPRFEASISNSNFIKSHIDPEFVNIQKNDFLKELETNLINSKASEANILTKSSANVEKLNRTVKNLTKGDVIRYINSFEKVMQSVNCHRAVQRAFRTKFTNALERSTIDWSTAELLAYASLVESGTNIFLTGQDVERGTFTHRHHILTNQNSPYENISIFQDIVDNNSKERRPNVIVKNSILSEYGVMSFAYGYSIVNPNDLVIWEAQFGDFANNAACIFDNYLSSCYSKWQQQTPLVIQLPHGYEGQGSEHSSCRVERFLQMSNEAEEAINGSNTNFNQINWIICSMSSPANFFHALRRQITMKDKRPLIILTPKSMLRNPEAISSIDELENNKFKSVISKRCKAPRNLILCSGKTIYDIQKNLKGIKAGQETDVIGLEQLSPFPFEELGEFADKAYANVIWAQEEPKNMGFWQYVQPRLQNIFGKIKFCGRPISAAPAAGSQSLHKSEQIKYMNDIIKAISQ